MSSFADLGVSPAVATALQHRHINSPFAIQDLVIPDILDGRDVLAQSPTGSGKTLAFGIPLADRVEPRDGDPSALILSPTRELALQIVDELRPIVKARSLRVAVVHGGVGLERQAAVASRAHIVVATPGRLEDLMQRRMLSISAIRFLVVDEADRMLDMGFKPALDRIVAATPRARQTLFFSATLEGVAGKQAKAYTTDARRHVFEPEVESRGDIVHRFVHLDHESKLKALVAELRHEERGRTLVFVRTKHGADRLVKRLSREQIKSVAMHGNKSQAQRQKALAAFERGEITCLVATDVAARGIDVADVTHVINFDIPEDRDTYVHRTGRTGRAGATGTAVTFVLADQRREVKTVARELDLDSQFDDAVTFARAPGSERRDDRQPQTSGSGNGSGKPQGSNTSHGAHKPRAHTSGGEGPNKQRNKRRRSSRSRQSSRQR
jgi:ATP-dependent RNA helicase RhlE